mmetsp:Transcript_4281/g.14531  ORF Transcript_4281/g.14531 Transcript_4281/m.14531 type:complete len:142 (+) Transcript_4281:76-501(+)
MVRTVVLFATLALVVGFAPRPQLRPTPLARPLNVASEPIPEPSLGEWLSQAVWRMFTLNEDRWPSLGGPTAYPHNPHRGADCDDERLGGAAWFLGEDAVARAVARMESRRSAMPPPAGHLQARPQEGLSLSKLAPESVLEE